MLSTQCSPDVFTTLDNLINKELLPAFTGWEFHHEQSERTLLSLPFRLGGLAIPVLSDIASDEYLASRVTEPLVDLIVNDNQNEARRMDSKPQTALLLAGGNRVNRAKKTTAETCE